MTSVRPRRNVGQRARKSAGRKPPLPASLKFLFWEYDFSKLSWEEDKNLVIEKVLTRGDLESIKWLRSKLTNDELRKWLVSCHGATLSRPALRFWELILGIPRRTVNTWFAHPGRQVWDDRFVG